MCSRRRLLCVSIEAGAESTYKKRHGGFMVIPAKFGNYVVAAVVNPCSPSQINAGPQARQRLRWHPRRLANRLGVTVGAIAFALSSAACGHLPGGELSCGQFLDEGLVRQEDIVETALSENGLSTENYANPALTTQQLRNYCSKAGDPSLTINDILDLLRIALRVG